MLRTKNNFWIFIGFLILLLNSLISIDFVIATPSKVTYLSECTKITKPGIYILNQSMTVDPKEKICLEINTSNVLIDGRMNTIYGFFEKGEKAILVNGNSTNNLRNITIKNVIIKDGYMGIKIKNSQDVSISSCYIKGVLEGISVLSSSRIYIIKSKIEAQQRAVISENVVSLKLEKNYISTNFSHCIDSNIGYYLNIEGNTFAHCSGSAIRLEKNYVPTIKENLIKNSLLGIEILKNNQAEFLNNILENTTQGISITSLNKGLFYQNLINKSQVGVFCNNGIDLFFDKNSIFTSDIAYLIKNSSNINITVGSIENIKKYLFLIQTSGSVFADFQEVNKSKSLIEDSKINVSIKKELLKGNAIYKDNATVEYIILNGSNKIVTENIKPLISTQKTLNISIPVYKKESLLSKSSLKHIIVLGIIIVILALIYAEVKLLTTTKNKSYRRKRKRR
ncbi:MAG: hypothetical protein PWP03_603 [Candidatus Woesearchaeota archaeon]|nr:hypothetical protein [Candidatus Woesearchaeota archaeon]MDN5327965.1 hypothetical protein [Candidatus Woesearchaeota archaeon]